MKPKSQESSGQTDLFNTRLVDFLQQRHELVLLATVIDWDTLDREFGQKTNGKPMGSDSIESAQLKGE